MRAIPSGMAAGGELPKLSVRSISLFLPVNGVLVEFPGYTPSGIPATLTPAEAAVATRLLRAQQLVPIHYDTFNNPPIYIEQSNISEQLAAAAEREKVQVNWVRENDVIRKSATGDGR